MSEFTIRVTETNGVVGISLQAPEESKQLAKLVADALTAVLPKIVIRAVKVAGSKCECPDCVQERAGKTGEMPAESPKTLH
ncbi:hypothetical protein [Pseudomonas putida]|uniref:hypothetical protein n=1 Tax=Pseudomonas putida TaxID=303 RepID=UPI002DB82B36|nr:hypothetical protein [Pseudomonas putida]WRW04703.1 hypothetical protein VPZ82_04590 [Pseudomonas putida]